MQVGDVMFVRQPDNQIWPGKVQKLTQDGAEVRLYKVNKIETFKHDQLEPFTPEVANQKHPNSNKQFATACKLASKDFRAKLKVPTPHRQVKKEQEDCKQEEEEEKEKHVVPVAVSYETLHAFIVAQNESQVMEDCQSGKAKEYQYLCSESGETVIVLKSPRYVLVMLLIDLLQGACTSRAKMERSNLQKRVSGILSKEILTCEDCLSSKIMKWINFSINRLAAQSQTAPADHNYLQELRRFSDKMRKQFMERICDFSGIAELVPALRGLKISD